MKIEGKPFRLIVDGNPLAVGDIPLITPRIATNSESGGWQDFIKGKTSFTINAADLIPIEEPRVIESEVKYYYRRGNKAFFKVNGRTISFIGDDVTKLKGLKYGIYPAKFTLV